MDVKIKNPDIKPGFLIAILNLFPSTSISPTTGQSDLDFNFELVS